MKFPNTRFLSCAFVVSCFIAGMTAAPQQAFAAKSFFEVISEWLNPPPEGPDPTKTLQAPFAYDPNKTIEQIDREPSTVPLRYANTTEAEIGKWLTTAVSDAMSFKTNSGQTNDLSEINARYFASSGKAQFRDFLVQNNIQKVVESGRYNISSFVSETPLLLNSGEANDRFRWLYEVPIMVSYMDSQKFNYKEDTPVNQHIVLTIQVGRFAKVEDGDNNFAVLIETWAGKSQKIDKK